MEHIESINLTR